MNSIEPHRLDAKAQRLPPTEIFARAMGIGAWALSYGAMMFLIACGVRFIWDHWK